MKLKGFRVAPVTNVVGALDIYIYDFIGKDFLGDGFNESDLVEEINQHGPVNLINVYINSEGGNFFSGITIYNVLKSHAAAVHTHIQGLAASAASVIALAGDTRTIYPGAQVMIHNPASFAGGEAKVLRKQADTLDELKDESARIYAAETNLNHEQAGTLMDEETWMNPQRAIELGFATQLAEQATERPELMAGMDLSMYRNVPVLLKKKLEAKPMDDDEVVDTGTTGNTGAPTQQAAPVATPPQPTPAPAQPNPQPQPQPQSPTLVLPGQYVMSDGVTLAQRNAHIANMIHLYPDMQAELTQYLGDTSTTLESVSNAIMQRTANNQSSMPVVGAQATQHGQDIQLQHDERDKQRAAAQQVIEMKASARDNNGNRIVIAQGNPYASNSMLEMAKVSLKWNNIDFTGRSANKIIEMALHTTSDFPELLNNVLHKLLLGEFRLAPRTWSRFCVVGSLSDYRPHDRQNMSEISSLKKLKESGELEYGKLYDGESESVTAEQNGLIVGLSKKAIRNDNLDAWSRMARKLGLAAGRSVENDVYALLLANNGAGPIMRNGSKLFNANKHGNVAAGAPFSMNTVDAMRVQMAKQKDPSGNEYLDLRPSVLLVPNSLYGDAVVLNESGTDPGVEGEERNNTNRNKVRGLFSDIVESPRLEDENAFYMFTDPNQEGVIEVAFLDGSEEPIIDFQQDFETKGLKWSVEHDYAVGAIGRRGVIKNSGVAQ